MHIVVCLRKRIHKIYTVNTSDHLPVIAKSFRNKWNRTRIWWLSIIQFGNFRNGRPLLYTFSLIRFYCFLRDLSTYTQGKGKRFLRGKRLITAKAQIKLEWPYHKKPKHTDMPKKTVILELRHNTCWTNVTRLHKSKFCGGMSEGFKLQDFKTLKEVSSRPSFRKLCRK